MPTRVQLKGFEQFSAQLKQLDFAKRKDVLVAAGLSAAEPIRVRAGDLAPEDRGTLKKNIQKAEDKKESDLGGITVSVGPTNKAFYGVFQEWGTAHHRAKPFMQPAIDQTAGEVDALLLKSLEAEIVKALSNG